jgi:hypothetical protein
VIELTRALARRFRAVLRRALMADDPRGPWPVVACRAGEAGLTLEACLRGVAVRYHQPGAFAPDSLAISGTLLAEVEGGGEAPVSLEAAAGGAAQARWAEGGVPRVLPFEPVPAADVPAFPDLPARLEPQPPGLLRALAEAVLIAPRESVRYALSRLQLRGRAGAVVATDGRQLLLQSGFHFPWAEDVLVPALPVFAGRDLPADAPVEVGRTDTAVTVRVGAWTLVLPVDTEGRFPKAEAVIPRPGAAASRLHLDPRDAAFLCDALPRLPGVQDEHGPVTLELAEPPAVRAWPAASGPAIEVTLSRSSASGPPVRVRTDRRFLRRALRLGFTDLEVVKADQPLCCRDDTRSYVWVPLDPQAAMPPDADVLRITSMDDSPTTPPATPPRRITPMAAPSRNGSTDHPEPASAAEPAAPDGLAAAIAEAEALRALLHEAAGRATRLLSGLKQQRRQSRAVVAAMEALRQLKIGR